MHEKKVFKCILKHKQTLPFHLEHFLSETYLEFSFFSWFKKKIYIIYMTAYWLTLQQVNISPTLNTTLGCVLYFTQNDLFFSAPGLWSSIGNVAGDRLMRDLLYTSELSLCQTS